MYTRHAPDLKKIEIDLLGPNPEIAKTLINIRQELKIAMAKTIPKSSKADVTQSPTPDMSVPKKDVIKVATQLKLAYEEMSTFKNSIEDFSSKLVDQEFKYEEKLDKQKDIIADLAK